MMSYQRGASVHLLLIWFVCLFGKVSSNFHSLRALTIDGEEQKMEIYKGKVCLVVNVASECGYTLSNYRGLVELQRRFTDKGFVILAFPCNQFGQQEPASNTEIKAFAQTEYGVTFQLFSKIDVIGQFAHPVYKYLSTQTQEVPRWNFAKYLVGRDGHVIKFYDTIVEPADIANDISKALTHAHTEF